MYVLYYASMLRCGHLVWILVRTNHPCLGVGCHMHPIHCIYVGASYMHICDRPHEARTRGNAGASTSRGR
jgi:hypothetical protein